MMRSERAALGAGVWLALVLLGLLGAWVLWHQALQPDYHLDRALRLEPVNGEGIIQPVPLQNGTRQPWPAQAGRPGLRFALTIPGDDPVLRFHEGFLQGLPLVSVRLHDEDGEVLELASYPATENAWTERRVAIPAEAGDEVQIEIRALDGEGRKGLGLIYVADVVLLSEGRLVDESEATLTTESVVQDLLIGAVLERTAAPPTPDSELVDLPGPACLPLVPTQQRVLELEPVPPRATLNLVLHAGKRTTSGLAGTTHVSVRVDDELVASLDLRSLAVPEEGQEPARELLHQLDLQPWVGTRPLVSLTLTGGDNLFVGLREAIVTAQRSRPRRPLHPRNGTNLLLVLVDGLRPDRLGAWGYERGHTPHLDEMAEKGLVYRRVLAPSSWPLPNVATVLTGVSPLRHGLGLRRGRVLGPRLTTLAQSATWGGTLTACFRSSGLLDPSTGLGRGYHENVWRPLPASTLVDGALDWLESARAFPWFLTLHVEDPLAPHVAEVADLEHLPLYPDPELMTRLEQLDSRPGVAEHMAGELGTLMDAEIARVDRALGRVLRALDDWGLLERTVVAVIGTSGQEVYEHGGVGAGQTLFDEVVHVPAILVGPGVPGGVAVDQPVALEELTGVLGTLGKVLTAGTRLGALPPPLGPRQPDRTLHALLRPFPGVTRQDQSASRRHDLLHLHDLPSGARALFRDDVDLLADGGDPSALAEAEALSEAFRAWYEAEVLGQAARPVPWHGGP